MVTAWIPLDDVPSQADGGTGLTFCEGSHRDFALPFWSRPHETGADLSGRYEERMASAGALTKGDVTWHHGWTLHSAPPLLAPEEFHEVFGGGRGTRSSDGEVLHGRSDGGGGGGEVNEGDVRLPPEVKSRLAFTVSFIADGARVLGPMAPKEDDAAKGKEEEVVEGRSDETAAPEMMLVDEEDEDEEDDDDEEEGGLSGLVMREIDGEIVFLDEGEDEGGFVVEDEEDYYSDEDEKEEDDEDEDEEEEEEERKPLYRVHEPEGEDCTSYEAWLGEIEPGAVADHPLLPVVWPPS